MNKSNNISTNSRIVRSTLAQVVSQIFVAGCAVIILKIMTRSMGVNRYGIYATALAFVSTFSLMTDLGLSAITGREIAKNPKNADEIISYNMGLRIFLCVVMIPAIIGLSYLFYFQNKSDLRIVIAVLSVYLFFDAFRSVALAYFTANVRNDITALVTGAQQFLLLVFSIIVAILSSSVFGFVIAYVASNAIGAIMAMYATRSQVRITPRINLRHWRAIIFMSISLGIIQIVNMLYLKADSILLSVFRGTKEVGIYSIAYSLVLAFLTLPSFIMTALIPSMATTKTTDDLSVIVEKAFSYMIIFACLLAVGGFVVRENIVLAVSGISFLSAATPFAILCFASAFSYITNVFGFASVSVNKHHKMVYVSLGSLILNVILNLFLIPRYSIDGAAWATVASEIVALGLIYVIYVRETGAKIAVFKYVYKPLVAALITLFACTYLKILWRTNSSLLNTFIASGVLLIIYAILLTIFRAIPLEVSRIIATRLRAISENRQ